MIKTLLWPGRLDLNQRPLAVLEKIFVLFAYSIFSTAAPSPAPCIIHRMQSQAMPSRTLGRWFWGKRKKALTTGIAETLWLRRLDLNQRPSGYEGLSAPRKSPPSLLFNKKFFKITNYKYIFYSKFLKEK